MKVRGVRSRIFARCRAIWRSERGIGIGELVIGLALAAAAIAGYQFVSKKVVPLGQAFLPLTNCQLAVEAALKEAEDRRKTHGDTFLADNDPIVVTYTECKAKIAAFSEEVKKANADAITALEGQISTGLAFAGKCFISDLAPSDPLGTAGASFTVTVDAVLPFGRGSVLPGTITATGAVTGSGVLSHKDGNKWSGQVVFPASASSHIKSYDQPRETSISASGNAAALVLANEGTGACPANTNPIPGSLVCEILTGGDGSCPAGLTPSGGKCYIACATPAFPKSIVWKIPDPPKILSFTVSPTEIIKGSTETVTLTYNIENAASASINLGVGEIITDPKGATGVRTSVVNPTPQSDTEWTLSATGVNAAVTTAAKAKLTVKPDPSKTSVAIAAPADKAQIADFTVAVSGTVTPVPPPEFRKAQILVNGALMNEVPIDAGGNFAGAAPLMNTIDLSDILVVGSAAVGVTRCGPVSSLISVSAPFAQANNGIRVVVPLPGGSASAQVGVEHVARVSSFTVDWSQTCGPAPSKSESPGSVLRAAQPAVPVGTVDCGVGGPTHCTDTASITVATSVGQKIVPQTWTINVDSCN